MGRWRKQDPRKRCKRCNKSMSRKKFGERLEDFTAFASRKYCSLSCAKSRGVTSIQGTYAQSRKQRKTFCEACTYIEQLQVHHVDGNPYNNKLQNLQTLCIYCHMFWHNTQSRLGLGTSIRMPSLFSKDTPKEWVSCVQAGMRLCPKKVRGSSKPPERQ